MPLEKSPTNAARGRNIAELVRSGRPRNQAVAIGYAEQRKAKSKKGKRK
jgi:hypothetical protein